MRYFLLALLVIFVNAQIKDTMLYWHNYKRSGFSFRDTPQKAGYTDSKAPLFFYKDSTQVWTKPESPLNPMTWSDEIAQVAQGWADQCKWGHNPDRGEYGENIYGFSSAIYNSNYAIQAVQGWYQELYMEGCIDPSNRKYQLSTCEGKHVGHAQQIIYQYTDMLGCAYKECPNGIEGWDIGKLFIVCNYFPAVSSDSTIYVAAGDE